MPFQYRPTFVLSAHGETQLLQTELKGEYSILASLDSSTTLSFSVLKQEKFLDYRVSVPVARSNWEVIAHSKKAEWHFRGVGPDDVERTWIPEQEIGKSVSEAISGIFSGNLSGETACSMLFDLFLHLEVELAEKDSWLAEYFPTFFRHYSQKLHRAKVSKVESVMES